MPRGMTITVAEAVRHSADRLKDIADNPRAEARLLVAHALGTTPQQVILRGAEPVDPALVEPLVARRLAREPMAYILGHRGFWTLDLQVSPATLIPRPDSETLVEAALQRIQTPPGRILDLGTGTGCLLLALLTVFPDAFGVGIDRVPAAAALARTNAACNGLAGRCAFLVGNWTDPVAGLFSLIVSNPPYIAAGDIPGLMPEVVLHEPHSALDGGADGLNAYRAILPRIAGHLAPDGMAVLELGAGQAQMVTDMARALGFQVALHRDLAGIERAAVLERPESR